MGNRKKAEALILEYAKEADPSGITTGIYQSLFKEWSDERFAEFITDLKAYGYIPLYVTVMYKDKLTIDQILDLAEKLGIQVMQHLQIHDNNDGSVYTTNKRYMILEVPERRQSQTLEEKISVSENFNTIDSTTGQTVGSSKGAGFSQPELMLSLGQDQQNKLIELMKFRGGDLDAQRDMLVSIMQEGVYHLNSYDGKTTTRGTDFMEVMFKGIHIDANFKE